MKFVAKLTITKKGLLQEEKGGKRTRKQNYRRHNLRLSVYC